MEQITVTTEFNTSLKASRFNGSACLVSNDRMVGFNNKPYTPVGGRKALKAIVNSGFVLGSKLFLLEGIA